MYIYIYIYTLYSPVLLEDGVDKVDQALRVHADLLQGERGFLVREDLHELVLRRGGDAESVYSEASRPPSRTGQFRNP